MTRAKGRAAGRAAWLLIAGVVLSGCSLGGDEGSGDGGTDNGTGNGSGNGSGTLDVLAASSLTESFGALAARFEDDHPGVEVRLVLESSTTLAQQVGEGAPADVLATADETSMQLVLDAGQAEDADVFATNELVLVTPDDNPAGIESVADLDDSDVAFVACVDTAPCGALAEQLLAENAVVNDPRSLEVDVKAVLSKVVTGEADAGLVYASDARAAGGDVLTFPVPGADAARTTYVVAVVDQSDDPGLAEDWVDLVLSADGQAVLADAGFGAAEGAQSP